MMEKGVCYLEVINFVFSHKYCQAITFNLLESEVLPIRDHPVLAHFVEIRSLLDVEIRSLLDKVFSSPSKC